MAYGQNAKATGAQPRALRSARGWAAEGAGGARLSAPIGWSRRPSSPGTRQLVAEGGVCGAPMNGGAGSRK